MRLTLQTAAPLLARYAVQGACVTDPRVLEKINEARERLMQKPQNWKNKVQRFLFCASKACVTLPREIETVEAATVCNRPMKMRGPWYDVLDSGPGSSGACGGDAVIDRGDGYVTFADFDQPRNVKIYADVPEVSTARMLLQGFDENGNRVRTWDERDSAYVDGEYVAISNESPAVSVTVFSSLDGIQKPETNGYVRVYAFTLGNAAAPVIDSTIATVWPGDNPAPGTLTWGGSLLSAAWGAPNEDEDIIVHLVFDGSEVNGNFYTNVGAPLFIHVDSWEFSPTVFEWRTLGPIISGSAGTLGGTLWRYTPAADSNPLLVGDKVRNAGIESEEFTVGFVLISGAPGSEEYYFEIAGNTTAFIAGTSIAESFAASSGNLTVTTESEEPTIASVVFQISGIIPPAKWGLQFYAIRLQRDYSAAVDAVPDYLSLLAIQHPDETHPSYRRYEVPALRNGCAVDAEPVDRQVIIMAKLRYLPVKRSTDFLVIENIGALKQMLLAINAEEKNEFDLAQKLEAKAEKILADELQNHIGDAATNNQPMQVQQDCWAAGDIPCIL
jgi:hypothetical protein